MNSKRYAIWETTQDHVYIEHLVPPEVDETNFQAVQAYVIELSKSGDSCFDIETIEIANLGDGFE